MQQHYNHLKSEIEAFFSSKGFDVVIEPSGSRGPDVQGVNKPLVGEIKHEKELRRDLHRKFWTDWNSSQKFGGKSTDYRLAANLPADAADVGNSARGWLAVVWGQLRYMVADAGLKEGWVIYENPAAFEPDLMEALRFLTDHSMIYPANPEYSESLGFCKIVYRSVP